QVNTFVGAVGEQQFSRLDAKVLGYNLLADIPHRIAGKILSVQLPQAFEHTRRASRRVLVEVQPQPLALAEWGMIFLQGADRFASLKHCHTSREWRPRARASLRSRQASEP